MSEFMKIVMSLSISGALLMLVVLGLKQIYKNKFSKRWQYFIWIIVVLRFLIPFTPSTINIRSLFERYCTTVSTRMEESPEGLESPKIPAAINMNNKESKQPQLPTDEDENITVNAAVQKPYNIYDYLFLGWSALALVLLVRKITIYQGFIQYIKAGNTEVSDIKILNLLSECQEKQNIKRRVELYHNALIASPMLIGFFRPSIVLPDCELEEKALTYIFMHELSHYRQHDMFYKWLIQIVVCIHWFNPFAYLLEKEVNKACELSCDEAVILLFNESVPREYGDTLLLFLRSNNLYKASLGSITLTEGAEQLKERLGAIMNFKRKTKTIRVLTGITTISIILGAAFVSVYPVSAAAQLHTAKTDSVGRNSEEKILWEIIAWDEIGKYQMPAQINRRTGTYIYDQALESGWYQEDDNDDGWTKDLEAQLDFCGTKDLEKQDCDNNGGWDDKDFLEMYGAYGIEKHGKSIYYQGALVNIFLDHRQDSSFYRLDMNPQGTVNIQIIHDKEGKISGVSYMTEEEVAKLMGELYGNEDIPAINTKQWDCSAFSAVEVSYQTDNIYIFPSATDKIILKEYLTEDQSNYYASAETKNNTLTIRSGDRPTENYKSYIELYLPNAVLNNIQVETISGAITIENYTGVLSLSSISGAIVICDSSIAGNIKAISGGIDISDTNIAGNINTISGNIECYPEGLLGDLYIQSSSGRIEAVFPEEISYYLKAKTATGKISSSYFQTYSEKKKEFSTSIGSNPKFTVGLETVSGGIDL